MKPKKQCNQAGCTKLVEYDISYCEKHKRHNNSNIYQDRLLKDEKYLKFYRSKQWTKTSLLYRYNHPICEKCEKNGVIVKANVVDHIVEVKDLWDKRFNTDNLMSLCHACHNTKTAKERLKRQPIGNRGC